MKTDVVSPDWATKLNQMRRSESKVANISDREMGLTELAELPGWKVIKKYVQERKRELKDNFRTGIKADGYELIGQKAIVVDIIEEELDGLVNMVENVRSEVKSIEVEPKTKKK